MSRRRDRWITLNPVSGHLTQQILQASLVLVLVLVTLATTNRVVQADGGGKLGTLRVGFSARVFPDVDQRDAQVAMELWTRELARGLGFDLKPKTTIFRRNTDLLESVKRGELLIVTLPATEYLQIRDKAPMTPVVVSRGAVGDGRKYVLLARRDSGIRSLADLRGKSIALIAPTKHEIGYLWLNVQLMHAGYRDMSAYFRQAKEAVTASQAIMSVFFRQADAALVTRSAYETNKALNPQTGRELAVIAESKNLLGDVSCVPNMVSPRMKQLIEQTALRLHETTVGKQLFTLFQVERAIPFQSSYLDGVVELLQERARLQTKRLRK